MPLLAVMAAAVVLSCCGNSNGNSAAVKHYCDVIDRTQGELQTLPAAGFNDEQGLQRRVFELDRIGNERQAAAPPDLTDDYRVFARYRGLSETDRNRPSEAQKKDAATARISRYIHDRCGLDVTE